MGRQAAVIPAGAPGGPFQSCDLAAHLFSKLFNTTNNNPRANTRKCRRALNGKGSYDYYLTPTGFLLLLLLAASGALGQRVGSTPAAEPTGLSCADCRLAAGSLDELARRPRQMDAYGQLNERLDLDKVKKLVCKELESELARERCRNFYFSQQASVLKWKEALATAAPSSGSSPTRISFLDFACIRELKLCCPEQSFGPKCAKCPKCAPNEQCAGEGTREGRGVCECKLGYTGANCAACSSGFYLADNGACKPCHHACLQCRAPGPKGCAACKRGFAWQPGWGCLDVDECLESNKQICGPNTFCVNTEGAHFCYECDRACAGCHGDGPDMCLACGAGYQLDSSNTCTAKRKSILAPEANYYRYAIYAGLCVCTCIILNNSVYLASLVGLCVALYIGASEYVMSGQPNAGGAPDGGGGGAQADRANQLAAQLARQASQQLGL